MKAACWLMERFGVAPALIGDILEGAAQHSVVWSRAQAVGAISSAVTRELRQHPVIILRAIVMGWWLYSLFNRTLQPHDALVRPPTDDLWLMARALIGFEMKIWLMKVTAAAVIGFTVSRLHRPHGMTAALSYVTTLLLLYAWASLDEIPRMLNGREHSPFAALVVPNLVLVCAMAFVIVPVTVMIGAALGAGRRRTRCDARA
jgi:hypothetical protein